MSMLIRRIKITPIREAKTMVMMKYKSSFLSLQSDTSGFSVGFVAIISTTALEDLTSVGILFSFA